MYFFIVVYMCRAATCNFYLKFLGYLVFSSENSFGKYQTQLFFFSKKVLYCVYLYLIDYYFILTRNFLVDIPVKLYCRNIHHKFQINKKLLVGALESFVASKYSCLKCAFNLQKAIIYQELVWYTKSLTYFERREWRRAIQAVDKYLSYQLKATALMARHQGLIFDMKQDAWHWHQLQVIGIATTLKTSYRVSFTV